MTNEFSGKVVLVTGGTTGIGFASALSFLQAGAKVIVTGRNPQTLEEARKRFEGRVDVVASDAGDVDAVRSLFAYVKETYGALDVLFLNAGVAKFAPIEQSDEALYDQLFNVNVKGLWFALKYASDVLAPNASVVLNTSIVNQAGMPGSSIYAATKAAVRSFARTAGAEWASRGIRVNAVSPGPIETPIYGKMGMPKEALDEFASGIVSQVPLGRFGSADEVAKAVVFLASPAASFITGSELAVDGGFSQV